MKEEQKVIHNEHGGLTFDSTFGDGTRHVHTNNDKGQRLESVYYAADGNVEKTEEFIYDSKNPDLYTVITRDNDGNTISKELWENYTFTDEEGRTWYGNRLVDSSYDANESEQDVLKLQKEIDVLKNSPNANPDLIAAFEEYENAIKEYDQKMDRFNAQQNYLGNVLDGLISQVDNFISMLTQTIS